MTKRLLWIYWFATAGLVATVQEGCKPSDILSVPPPTGIVVSSAIQNQTAAEAAFNQARYNLFVNFENSGGTTELSGLLTDEFTATFAGGGTNYLDARFTAGVGNISSEPGSAPLAALIKARSELLNAAGLLQQYEVGAGRSQIGEAYALAGYAELVMAENYCAGVPLSRTVFGGGIVYGTPLTTDSLLDTAAAHFDSALVQANGNDTIQSLASIGLGRTELDRGQYAMAAAAVGSVATAFVYLAQTGTPQTDGTASFYATYASYQGYAQSTVSDREGSNGLDFVSAGDPRLVLNSSLAGTADGAFFGLPDNVYNYPVKFGDPTIANVPLATGVEARLIEAEAALQANSSDVNVWAADLRALRADSADTHVTFPAADSLPADSAETASADSQVSLMFRERAFWLFGTGTRLGDLRRLIRQYHRDAETVFPTGPYDPALQANVTFQQRLQFPLPDYGTDVNITLPTGFNGSENTTNPNYKGCITTTTTA